MGLFEITTIFLIPSLSIVGFILNILSIIVFILIIKSGQRDDMYKHLLLKSIFEALGCFFSGFSALFNYDGNLKFTFIMVVWFIWFQNYIINALFMASTGFEIAATFNCAISIEKRLKWCEKRLSFWLWVVSIFVLSFGVEMFPIFMYSIVESNDIDQFNQTVHKYHFSKNSLFFKNDALSLGESIIREVMFLLILLLLNIYILFKLIQIGRRKKRLTSNNSNVQNSNRAEKRKIIMIIVLFLTFILGHLPNFMWCVFHHNFGSEQFWHTVLSYGIIFFYFSLSASFFFFFAFNNIFKSYFLKIIRFRSF
jgi:hypothetical protein